jgi:Mce-associated membrane protein
VAVVAWGAVLLVHDRQASDARRSALAQAGPLTTRILSYDYRSLDTDLSLARADTTGQFRQQFTDLTMRAVAPTARAQHVVTQANVTAVGVMDAKPDHAVALVFLNQTTSSTQLPSPEIAESRVRLELTKVGGQWLVSDLAPL